MPIALIGIDIGTSSSKGVLVLPDGEIVRTAQRVHSVERPHVGHAEQDATALWWAEFVDICRELQSDAQYEVVGVCVSGLGPCLLPVDRSGMPLRPAILYAIDTRSSHEIDEMDAALGKDDILRRCGHKLTAQSVGPKLAWLRRYERRVYENTRRIFTSSNFIVQRLTGAYVIDHTTASMYDPFYNATTQTWDTDWAFELLGEIELPELCWPSDMVGHVHERAAAETYLPVGTPVACGTIDFWAESISVGVEASGECMLAYGTTMSVSAVSDITPRKSDVGWAPASVPGLFHVGGATAAAGALTAWIKALTGDTPFERLLDGAATVEPGSEGLLMLPYFAGERSPIFDSAARGVIAGLTLRHTSDHLYRAALEATGYAVRHILESMNDSAEMAETELVATGGGTRRALWPQIVTDITGYRQRMPTVLIGASYGDALIAARAVGLADTSTRWNSTKSVVSPSPKATTVYDELYDLYRSLDGATRSISHSLARISA